MIGAYCRVKICGLNLERLMQQAINSDIRLSEIKRKGSSISALVTEADLQLLFALAESGGWTLQVGSKHGIARIREVIRRNGLLLTGICAAFVLAITLTQLMWRIEWKDAGLYQPDAEAFLRMMNIQPPMWKHNIDFTRIRDMLEWRYPDVAWVECGWRGTTLQISFVQGIAADNQPVPGSGHIIAARDGIVDSIITAAGTPQVKAGDVVRKGQVLIQGRERTANEDTVAVMARGVVMARVWEGASIRMSTMETITSYTGRSTSSTIVTGPWFDFSQHIAPDYAQMDIQRRSTPLGGLFFPFVLRQETCWEIETNRSKRDPSLLYAEAEAAALRLLGNKAGERDDFVDKWVDCCMIEDEVLEAVAIGERIIDIAQPTREAD